MTTKGNNFKTIRPIITFFFLFSAIIMCAPSPCRVFASGSTSPAINEAKEEIATFDEDEQATFDQASAADVSSLLYAGHYRPPVYFPERQKRSVTSYAWMHIIPFAALVMLALAATRFLGRRREKSSMAVKSTEGACQ